MILQTRNIHRGDQDDIRHIQDTLLIGIDVRINGFEFRRIRGGTSSCKGFALQGSDQQSSHNRVAAGTASPKPVADPGCTMPQGAFCGSNYIVDNLGL